MESNITLDAGEKILNSLEKLAQLLGVTVEKIYPYYLKQVVLDGYVTAASVIFPSILLTILCAYFGCKGFKLRQMRKFESDDEHLPFVMVFGISGICLLLLIIFGVGVVGNGITKILNPEYHAIHEIIQDISTLTGD